MRSGFGDDHCGQWGNGWVQSADPQPIAEVMPERQAELLAGIHQAKHAVARLPAVTTDCASRDLPLDDKAARTMRIFSSAEYVARVLRRMFWISFSAATLDVPAFCVISIS